MRIDNPEAFIRARMAPVPAPGAPEILLYAATPHTGLRWLAEHGENPPYWAFAWAGGCALARHILDRPETVCGLRVMDLGCGGGIVAVAAAKAGASAVLAADSDDIALTAAHLNAEANGLAVATAHVDLNDPPPSGVDLILVGDVFYEAELARLVVAYLDRCLGAGIPALVGDPYRRALPRERLDLLAEYAMPDIGDVVSGVKTGVFAYRRD